MKKYLEIEALPDPAERIAVLRAYLRGALVSEERWTRSNAAREFAALAAEVPGTLTAEDRPPLENALAHTRETALRTLIQSALDECPGAASRKLRPSEPFADGTEAATEATTRYAAKDATVAQRRQAVIDAAVRAGARGAALFELALDDDAPPVREAAAAAAGEYRIASLEPKVAAILVDDASPVVRRTAVVAAGYLKSSRSVPTLAILAKDGRPFSLEATFALARIRDDAAVAALRTLADEATDRERRELLAFLLSDAFVEQEKALTQKP
jgi:HEAT repeat protein